MATTQETIASDPVNVKAPPGRIESLVVKVAELCNLNCSYCYIYNHEDKSYLRRPKLMSEMVFEQLLRRVKDYCDDHSPHQINLTLHGGEPMLLGPSRIEAYSRRAHEVLGERLAGICMQTNGTLINDKWIGVFLRNRIPVSVSLDGPPEVHDATRVDHLGRGSHSAVLQGLKRLQAAGMQPGVLSVINPAADGGAIYRYFRSLGLTRMEFLLPDVSHDHKERLYGHLGATPVGDFLIAVFDVWFDEDDPDVVVRVLYGLLSSIMGATHLSDAFGNPLTSYLIIETDGSIQANDALRVCEEGIADTGLSIFTHGFDDLKQGLPLAWRATHEGIPLCATCLRCPEIEVCGGGYLPHRYARANGFDNTSVWCADILALIAHLRSRIGLLRGAPRPLAPV